MSLLLISNDLWQVIQAKLENVGAQLLAGGSTTTDTLWPSTRLATSHLRSIFQLANFLLHTM
jgi:hypothetical protein